MKYVQALRPNQWYKNLVIFLPLLFSGNLGNSFAFASSLIAFVSFCALSSATYVINDYVDRKKDALHPEKSQRPIAQGKIDIVGVIILATILLCTGLSLLQLLPNTTTYFALGYIILSQIYTFYLKHEAFADILAIAINFVLRAIAGAFAINVWVSPWLVTGVFFLALFLIVSKRKGEQMLLQEKAAFQRKTLNIYTKEMLNELSTFATTALILSYTLFVFFGEHQGLYITLPIAIYAILRYDYLVSAGSSIARHPHYAFFDVRLLLSMIIWTILTLFILY